MQPEKGERYLHYKGKLYVVLGMAMHSETDEDMVIYQCERSKVVFVRPLSMWNDIVNVGYNLKRFTKV